MTVVLLGFSRCLLCHLRVHQVPSRRQRSFCSATHSTCQSHAGRFPGRNSESRHPCFSLVLSPLVWISLCLFFPQVVFICLPSLEGQLSSLLLLLHLPAIAAFFFSFTTVYPRWTPLACVLILLPFQFHGVLFKKGAAREPREGGGRGFGSGPPGSSWVG